MHLISLEQYRNRFPNSQIESKLWKQSQSDGHIGQPAWNKGESRITNRKVAKYANKLRGKERSAEHCSNLSKTKKQQFKDPEFCKRMLANITRKASAVRPNKPEQKILDLLERKYPNEWKYVGNCGLVLGGLIPDFVNVNGEKLLIEVFGDYWHRNSNEQKRIDHFKQFGFSTLIIWERDINKKIGLVEKMIDDFLSVETVHKASQVDEDTVRS
jgi:very-short-patch-repair endonuclease